MSRRRLRRSYTSAAVASPITLTVNNTYGVAQGGTIRGIAPFPIYLEMADSTAVALTSYPYHEIEYKTNFGESVSPGTDAWTYGARSSSATPKNKNVEYGPVVGHIYETPGTYSVTCTARYGASSKVSTVYTVVVDDPNDSVNGYANVSCISTSSSTADDPAAAAGQTVTHITVTTWEEVIAHVASKVGAKWYFRLKKGDVFYFGGATTVVVNFLQYGNFRMDAYGPAATNPTVALSYIAGSPSFTKSVTITIASPGVVTWLSHGLIAGQPIHFTTTSALPTGLSINTTYYVIAAGLTADTFRVSATSGGAAINTSGSQSGSHLGRIGIASAVTMTIASPGVITWTGHGFSAGQPLVFTTTGALPTGITASTVYYVIAAGLGANDFQVSATLGGAAVNTSGSQSGVHTAKAGSTQAIAVTTSIASPCVVTWPGHDLVAGHPLNLTTTGALPTGLTASRVYWVSATGLTADTFQLSTIPGGASINTSGSQSGVHSAHITLASATYGAFMLGSVKSGTAGPNPSSTGMTKFAIQDIIIDGTNDLSKYVGAFMTQGGFSNACFLRVEAQGCRIFFSSTIGFCDQQNANALHGVGMSDRAGHIPWHGLVIQECSKTNNKIGDSTDSSTLPYGCFLEAKRFVIQGCSFDLECDTSREVSHGIRIAYGYKYALSHNYVARSGNFQDSFKLQAGSMNASLPHTVGTTNGSASILDTNHHATLGDPFAWNTQFAPPTPFVYGAKTYYVVTIVDANNIEISDTLGGSPITATQTNASASAGRYSSWGTAASVNVTWHESLQGDTSEGSLNCDGQQYSPVGGVSQYGYIHDNTGRGNASPEWMMAGTQQAGDSGNCYDFIFDGNWAQPSSSVQFMQFPFSTEGVRITMRNNLADVNDALFHTGFYSGNLRGVGPIPHSVPFDTWMYCNAVRNTSAAVHNDFQAIVLESYLTGGLVKNNLAWDSVLTLGTMTGGTIGVAGSAVGATGVTISNNSSNTQVKPVGSGGTDPLFVGVTSSVDNWKVQAGSYAKNAGADVPVWSDFWDNVRPTGAKDIGPFEQ